MLKLYGSPLCPDCTACKAAFDANGIIFEFVDVTGSMRNLKEFLKYRDTDKVFEEARQNGYVGIPALIMENGSITLDWESYLKENGFSADAAIPVGKACRIDGSGC